MSFAGAYDGQWMSVADIEKSLMQASSIKQDSKDSTRASLITHKASQKGFIENARPHPQAPALDEEMFTQPPKVFGRGQLLKHLEQSCTWGYKDNCVKELMKQVPSLSMGLSDQVFQDALSRPAQFDDSAQDEIVFDDVKEPRFNPPTVNWSKLIASNDDDIVTSDLTEVEVEKKKNEEKEEIETARTVDLTPKYDTRTDSCVSKSAHSTVTNGSLLVSTGPSRIAEMFLDYEDESQYVKVDMPSINPPSSPLEKQVPSKDQGLVNSPERLVEANDEALHYIEEVKLTFHDQPEVFDEFLEILNSKTDETDVALMMERVSRLFLPHSHLLRKFNDFFLPGSQIPTDDLNSDLVPKKNPQLPVPSKPRRCRNFLILKLLEKDANVLPGEDGAVSNLSEDNGSECAEAANGDSTSTPSREFTLTGVGSQNTDGDVSGDSESSHDELHASIVLLKPQDVISGCSSRSGISNEHSPEASTSFSLHVVESNTEESAAAAVDSLSNTGPSNSAIVHGISGLSKDTSHHLENLTVQYDSSHEELAEFVDSENDENAEDLGDNSQSVIEYVLSPLTPESFIDMLTKREMRCESSKSVSPPTAAMNNSDENESCDRFVVPRECSNDLSPKNEETTLISSDADLVPAEPSKDVSMQSESESTSDLSTSCSLVPCTSNIATTESLARERACEDPSDLSNPTSSQIITSTDLTHLGMRMGIFPETAEFQEPQNSYILDYSLDTPSSDGSIKLGVSESPSSVMSQSKEMDSLVADLSSLVLNLGCSDSSSVPNSAQSTDVAPKDVNEVILPVDLVSPCSVSDGAGSLLLRPDQVVQTLPGVNAQQVQEALQKLASDATD